MRIILFFLLIISCSSSKTLDNSRETWENKILSNISLEKVYRTIENEDFEVFYNRKDIPKPLMDTLKRWDNKLKFANPSQKYEATDFITSNRPSRQIIIVLKNESHTIFTYNHGGIGRHEHILWSEIKDDEVIDLWIGVGYGLYDKNRILDFLAQALEKLNTNMVCF